MINLFTFYRLKLLTCIFAFVVLKINIIFFRLHNKILLFIWSATNLCRVQCYILRLKYAVNCTNFSNLTYSSREVFTTSSFPLLKIIFDLIVKLSVPVCRRRFSTKSDVTLHLRTLVNTILIASSTISLRLRLRLRLRTLVNMGTVPFFNRIRKN